MFNFKYCWIGNETDEYDYGTSQSDEEPEQRVARYKKNAEHFKSSWPTKVEDLQKVVGGKKKLKHESRAKERLEYLGFIRFACSNFFDAKQLVSKQKLTKKKKVWQAFKKSQFGPLRYSNAKFLNCC